jgi:hypothetical protein
VAVHVTDVEPTVNVDPLDGVQNTDTGATPPVAVAEPKVTTADCPLLAVTGDGATGHEIAGGGMIMVGRVGLLHVRVNKAAVARPVLTARDSPRERVIRPRSS